MVHIRRRSSPSICQDEAVRIAADFAWGNRLEVGGIVGVRHITADEYNRALSFPRKSGTWMVSFKYAGPPIERDPDVVITPAPDSPITINVDDVSGQAELLWLL